MKEKLLRQYIGTYMKISYIFHLQKRITAVIIICRNKEIFGKKRLQHTYVSKFWVCYQTKHFAKEAFHYFHVNNVIMSSMISRE